MFSCEIYEIFKYIFFNKTPPMTASVLISFDFLLDIWQMALANVPFLYPLEKHFLTILTGKKYVLLNSVYKQPPEVFYKEGGLTNFVELTGKLLY